VTPPKSSHSSRPSSPRIACYGTVFLANGPVDSAVLKRGIASDVPQFGSPRLDASFLINCGRFLTGKVMTMDAPSTYVKRVAGTDFRSPTATVLYECSTELRELLAALTAERAAEMATDWYGMYGPAKTKLAEANGRTQRRLSILNNLAALAKQTKVGETHLMLRVDYRKQR
jgi:hypothetical protein